MNDAPDQTDDQPRGQEIAVRNGDAMTDAEMRRSMIPAGNAIGGLNPENLFQMLEVAKVMSRAGPLIPSYMRENPGACLGICIQAAEWRMSPFAVANKSYVVTNGGEERVAYESQLIHAVIEARAPLRGRLKVRYEGEGDDRRCIVTGHFKGEDEPSEFRSETLGKRRPERNQYGKVKGSPLWDTKPDLQQFYDASRDWARMYCPDVLMGVYARDELEELEPAKIEPPKQPTSFIERIGGGTKATEGFDEAHIDRTLNGGAKAPADDKPAPKDDPKPKAAAKETAKPDEWDGRAWQGAIDADKADNAPDPLALMADAQSNDDGIGSVADAIASFTATGGSLQRLQDAVALFGGAMTSANDITRAIAAIEKAEQARRDEQVAATIRGTTAAAAKATPEREAARDAPTEPEATAQGSTEKAQGEPEQKAAVTQSAAREGRASDDAGFDNGRDHPPAKPPPGSSIHSEQDLNAAEEIGARHFRKGMGKKTNPYKEPGQEPLAAAWLVGFDRAKKAEAES